MLKGSQCRLVTNLKSLWTIPLKSLSHNDSVTYPIAKYITIYVIVLIPALTEHNFAIEHTHECVYQDRSGSHLWCCTQSTLWPDVCNRVEERRHFKTTTKNCQKTFSFQFCSVHMVDRKNNCDETRMRFQIFRGVWAKFWNPPLCKRMFSLQFSHV